MACANRWHSSLHTCLCDGRGVLMARVLVLIFLVFLFSELLSRKSRRSRNAMSPYTNSLDSLLSGEEVSLEFGKSEVCHPRQAKQPQPVPSPARRTGDRRH